MLLLVELSQAPDSSSSPNSPIADKYFGHDILFVRYEDEGIHDAGDTSNYCYY